MEQVTGIEPASPAWKAGALTIVLHLRSPSVENVSLDIIPWKYSTVKRFGEKNIVIGKFFLFVPLSRFLTFSDL